MGRVVDTPQINVEIMVQVRPTKIAGFRPNMSDALPQRIAVVHCEREKTAEVMPAHFATSFFFTPKLSIISGCENVSVLRRWGIVTHEVWKDRSHGDRFCKSTYCFVPISLCSECINCHRKQNVRFQVWSFKDVDPSNDEESRIFCKAPVRRDRISQLQEQSENCRFLASVFQGYFQNFGPQICPITPHSLSAVLTQPSRSLATTRNEPSSLQIDGLVCEQN